MKKLALSIRLLSLGFFLLFSLSWHSDNINADAATGSDPVAQTGLTLPIQPALQTTLPPPELSTLKATPTHILLPVTEAPSLISGAFRQFVESVVDGQVGILRGVYVEDVLAHNYLSGELFFQLELDQQVQLVYGDGRVARYMISRIERFQKLQPNNPRSRYIDLNTGEEQSTEQVFNRVYTGKDHVTFQTCIKKGEEWSWGLVFILATPIE